MSLSSLVAVAIVTAATAQAEEAWPGQVSAGANHYDLEEMYAAGEHTSGLAEARRRYAADPTDTDLTWHIARFIFEQGEAIDRNDKSVDKVALYTDMVDVAEQGLSVNPNDAHIRFARGVANGRLGTTRGVIASLWSAKGIEQDWLFVANSGFEYASINGDEQLPCDADLALGIFYRLVPDSFIVQMLAGTRGSLDKSLNHLTTANQCSPNRIGTMKELAVTQMCLGTKKKNPALVDQGKANIREYMTLTPGDNKDVIDIAHGKLLLADPGIACGYSRDGQQNLDTSKLKK